LPPGNSPTCGGIAIERPVHFNWVTDILEKHYLPLYGDKRALVWTDGDKEITYTYEELIRKSNQLLHFLQARGIRQGDVLFVMLPVVLPNWLTYIACIKGGLVMIPAATILGEKDIEYRFDNNHPSVIISDAENAGKIDSALASGKAGPAGQDAADLFTGSTSGVPGPIKILVSGQRDGWFSWAEIERSDTDCTAAATRADDVLFLFFTSGTTGMPKIVAHTHLSYPFGHLTTAAWIGLQPGDLHYNIAQPGWAKFAWSSFFAPLSMGAAVLIFQQAGRMDTAVQLAVAEKYKVSTFCAPPTALRMLVLEDLKRYRFAFRECLSAGEPLNPEVIEAWKKGTGIVIRDGYGQTETTLLAGNLPGDPVKYGSMGKQAFLYEVEIVDDSGNGLPVDEGGHIGVKVSDAVSGARPDDGRSRPNGVFKEYSGEPGKRDALIKNGYYLTGDKAYKDRDGYIWFVGRDDDVIKSSDYRIGPFEVESVLIEHEAVIESAVVGSPHPIRGHVVKAFVITGPGVDITKELADELFDFCEKSLSSYKMPRIIEFVGELPKTISGKIRRVELRASEAMNKARGIRGAQEFFYDRKPK
jgi:acyl-coenzyme A synthetase/AMP-(fatty) acid ligase